MEQRQCYNYKLSVVRFKQQFLIMKKVLLYVRLEFGVTFRGPQVKLLTNIVKDTNQSLYLLVTATSLAPTLPLIGSVRANSAHPENRYIIFSYNFCYVGASRTTDVTKIRINSDT